MRNIYRASVVLLVTWLAACAMPAPSGVGGFSVKVDAVSPIVQQILDRAQDTGNSSMKSSSSGARAYMAAPRVDFTLTRVSPPYDVVDAWTITPDVAEEWPTEFGERRVPAGSYCLKATVYNPADTPVVEGSVEFEVQAAQEAIDNVVIVPCKPLNPVEVSEGAWSTPFTLATPWSEDTIIGSEGWFEVVPSSTVTKFALVPDLASSAIPLCVVFNEAGHYVTSGSFTMASVPSYVAADTTPGSHYYVGVIDLSMPGASRAMKFHYSPPLYASDCESSKSMKSDGMWHIVSSGEWNEAHSGSSSWWYGQQSTGTFDNGDANQGLLQTPAIDIPADSLAASLDFWYWYETETTGTSYDQRWVMVSTDGGTNWDELDQLSGDTMGVWHPYSADLSAYAGQSVKIGFYFDTGDDISNDYRGWYIDDILITE